MSRKHRRAHLQSGYVKPQMAAPPPPVKRAPAPAPVEPPKIYEDEDILPDDFPVHVAYCYVADGRVVRSMLSGQVRHLKADIPAKEIRRCNLAARDLF